jgi:hypothetical protein
MNEGPDKVVRALHLDTKARSGARVPTGRGWLRSRAATAAGELSAAMMASAVSASCRRLAACVDIGEAAQAERNADALR